MVMLDMATGEPTAADYGVNPPEYCTSRGGENWLGVRAI